MGLFSGPSTCFRTWKREKPGTLLIYYGGGGVTPAGVCTYMATKDGIRTFTRYVAEEVRDSNVCVVTFSPRVPIVTETAPEEALKRLPGPDVLGNAFVLAAQLPIEKSGQCFAYADGKLVNELPREG
jgi:NAD(P)-dependent dehydrogenase (short-subunit alcohol dehydrogenase family)